MRVFTLFDSIITEGRTDGRTDGLLLPTHKRLLIGRVFRLVPLFRIWFWRWPSSSAFASFLRRPLKSTLSSKKIYQLSNSSRTRFSFSTLRATCLFICCVPKAFERHSSNSSAGPRFEIRFPRSIFLSLIISCLFRVFG